MKPIALNLASRPFRNNAAVASALAGVAAALALATAYNLYFFLHYGDSYAALQAEQAADRARLTKVEAEERSLSQQIQGRNFRRLYDRGRFASELILKRSFSWTLLFNKLEAVVPPEIMMTAIHPNVTADGIIVRIDGMAKSSGGFITLQERLLANAAFSRVFPISERRINPNRPDISFALNFGYMPKAAAPTEVLASAAAPASPAPPKAGQPGAPSGPSRTTEASPRPAGAAAPGSRVEPESVVSAGPARGTVGRDGQPRAAALWSRMIAAPGGVYLPAGPPPEEAPVGKRQRDRSKSRSPEKTNGPPAAPSPRAPAPAAGALGARPAAAATPARSERPTVPRELGLPPWLDAVASARAKTPDPPKVAAPAVRLDVPLTFALRPVREVYDALAKAHGVRFVLEPAVNGSARVSLNLSGRALADAISIVARTAGHKVTHRADGSYDVTPDAGGEPIADKPISEESLAPQGGKP